MSSILLVDDDPAVREIFTAYLENGGYHVFSVSGGEECLRLLKTCRPDLILLDLMMEPMDGWQTLLAIRHNPATSRIPVLIVTGKQPEPGEIMQYGGMIEDFIIKPLEFGTIIATLHRIIEDTHELEQEIYRKTREKQDPELIGEYISLLHLVRITARLSKRFRFRQWADRTLVRNREEHLRELHTRLGLPDHFLERDNGRLAGG
jgi:two-component system OmpR family response regulator